MAKHKKRKRKVSTKPTFPMLYPSKMGTPYSMPQGSGNESGVSPSIGGSTGMGIAATAGESRLNSRDKVISEMAKALGLTEYFDDSPGKAAGGYAIPSFGSVGMRQGGPTIGGPGFQYDGEEGAGGKIDMKKSPGLGFRTEAAWRIWDKAIEIINQDKTLPRHSILLRAMAKAGVNRGQIDPAELRLLEMGIEWYFNSTGAAGAARTIAY